MLRWAELIQKNMPVSFLLELAKEDCVMIGGSLGLELKGTEHLGQLRKILKEKWK
jgi:hypothetical protein